MANEQNLKPVRTKKEARERGRAGGKASGKARREKKLLKDCLTELLERTYQAEDGRQMDGMELISARLFLNARSGDNKAFEIIRDTIGQKPVERIESVDIAPETYARVAAMLEQSEDEEAPEQSS